jgi:hypothetical protein
MRDKEFDTVARPGIFKGTRDVGGLNREAAKCKQDDKKAVFKHARWFLKTAAKDRSYLLRQPPVYSIFNACQHYENANSSDCSLAAPFLLFSKIPGFSQWIYERERPGRRRAVVHRRAV